MTDKNIIYIIGYRQRDKAWGCLLENFPNFYTRSDSLLIEQVGGLSIFLWHSTEARREVYMSGLLRWGNVLVFWKISGAKCRRSVRNVWVIGPCQPEGLTADVRRTVYIFNPAALFMVFLRCTAFTLLVKLTFLGVCPKGQVLAMLFNNLSPNIFPIFLTSFR